MSVEFILLPYSLKRLELSIEFILLSYSLKRCDSFEIYRDSDSSIPVDYLWEREYTYIFVKKDENFNVLTKMLNLRFNKLLIWYLLIYRGSFHFLSINFRLNLVSEHWQREGGHGVTFLKEISIWFFLFFFATLMS